MTIVIADDLTGAAEMAGLAHSHGLTTVLLTDRMGGVPLCQVLVLATDTRSMMESKAVEELNGWLQWMGENGLLAKQHTLFKKTDSALRGHVVAELCAVMAAADLERAWYVPANPSKGRVVSDGTYFIDGKPISETPFADDPEFPAWSSNLAERFPDAEARGIHMPDVDSMEAMGKLVAQCPEGTLLAGAADLFISLLHKKGFQEREGLENAASKDSALETVLVICGSTQSKPEHWSLPMAAMPIEVYEGRTDAAAWVSTARSRYDENSGLLLHIPFHHLTGREVAVRLRQVTAQVVAALMEACQPAHLVMEGGATAACCLQALGWRALRIVGQPASGVVTMVERHGTRVTLKPGSYPWGNQPFLNSLII